MRLELDEHAIQAAVVRWADLQLGVFPELELLYAIPNGGHRHIRVAQKLKAEGVKPGIPDLHLPVARGGYLGLWIEMKDARGPVRKRQKEIHELLREQGHLVVVCRDIEPAIEVLRGYLRGEIKNPGSTRWQPLAGVQGTSQ